MQLEFNKQEDKIEEVLNKIESCYYDWTSQKVEKRNKALKFVEMVSKEVSNYKNSGTTLKINGNEMTIINDNIILLFRI